MPISPDFLVTDHNEQSTFFEVKHFVRFSNLILGMDLKRNKELR
ncbi:hypothetical protein [Vibrio gallaecicus]|nr:hypothetical protein [Vibrio gallaecicus]MDN3613327.1 hypothetical protein [Vibrio gallaecicus]